MLTAKSPDLSLAQNLLNEVQSHLRKRDISIGWPKNREELVSKIKKDANEILKSWYEKAFLGLIARWEKVIERNGEMTDHGSLRMLFSVSSTPILLFLMKLMEIGGTFIIFLKIQYTRVKKRHPKPPFFYKKTLVFAKYPAKMKTIKLLKKVTHFRFSAGG